MKAWKERERENESDSLIFNAVFRRALLEKTSLSKNDFFLMPGFWKLYVRTRDL